MTSPTPTPTAGSASVDVAELRRLLMVATPGPWEPCAEPEFVGIFGGDDEQNSGNHVADCSHADAALIVALRNNAEALIAAAEAARPSGWRRTAEELPDEDQECVIFDGENYSFACFVQDSAGKWFWSSGNDDYWDLDDDLLWMPVPPLPDAAAPRLDSREGLEGQQQ
jgi:hypothetical protein